MTSQSEIDAWKSATKAQFEAAVIEKERYVSNVKIDWGYPDKDAESRALQAEKEKLATGGYVVSEVAGLMSMGDRKLYGVQYIDIRVEGRSGNDRNGDPWVSKIDLTMRLPKPMKMPLEQDRLARLHLGVFPAVHLLTKRETIEEVEQDLMVLGVSARVYVDGPIRKSINSTIFELTESSKFVERAFLKD